MLGACDFRVSSFLGFSGAADCCQNFLIFWVVSVKAYDFQGFKLSRVQWCRRLLRAIYSSWYGFMLGACVFRVSSFLGFSGAADCCQKFSIFWVLSCQGFVFLGIQLSRVQCCRVFL
jgi:ABC-type Co2+ transport system permease subunit